MNKKIYTGILFLFAVLTGIRAQIGKLSWQTFMSPKKEPPLTISKTPFTKWTERKIWLRTGNGWHHRRGWPCFHAKSESSSRPIKSQILYHSRKSWNKMERKRSDGFRACFWRRTFKFEHKGFLFLGFNSGPLMRMADGHVVPQDITCLRKNWKRPEKRNPYFWSLTIRC